MTTPDAKRVREFLAAVCDALDSSDPVACWPTWSPNAVRALTAPLLVGVAVSAAGCHRPMGVKYAGPPPPPTDDPVPIRPTETVGSPAGSQAPPAAFPGAAEQPPADDGSVGDAPVAPDPEPPDMVVKYGAPPPSDVAPKYGIPIESLPVAPPEGEPLPGQKYGVPPPGRVETRYGIPF